MIENVLLIVAAGKSSRFGGFPKAFCEIGNITNADNTINRAKSFFKKVYIGVNSETFSNFYDKIDGCEMFRIVPGQGDAHSLLKCINYVKEQEPQLKRIYVCWGDAVFVNDQPFEQFIGANESDGFKVGVACALDKNPYAWFDINEDRRIIKSHFASEEGAIDEGMHDQSLFSFDIDFVVKYLNEFRESLNIPCDNDEAAADRNEMKLLFSFDYLREKGYELAKCVPITPGNVLSFNTQEELEAVRTIMGV